MKYFRTKDGRIIENRCGNKTDWLCGSPGTIQKYYSTDAGAIWEKDIINQADTIEKLCDEFYIDYGKKRFPYSTFRQYERYAGWGDLIRYLREIHFTGYDNVYGYVWLKDELHKVAKMNNKGELELL